MTSSTSQGLRTGPVLSAVLLGPSLLEAQLQCADCQELSKEQKFDVRPSGGEGVLASFSSGSARVLLPVQFRWDAFDSVHGLAHPSVRATRRLLSSRFLWPSMNANISTWAKDCLPCQVAKVLRHQKTPLQSIPVPARRFSHVHMDLVGPLKSSKGFTSLLTIIDRSSRWPEVIPMSSTTSTECFDAFLPHWISCFGVPATLTTDRDRGPQFTSTVWASLWKSLGIHHIMTMAFHPQADRSDSVYVYRLKPVILSVPVEAHVPPRRGRPPKQWPDPPAAARRPRGRPRKFQPSASVAAKSGGEV